MSPQICVQCQEVKMYPHICAVCQEVKMYPHICAASLGVKIYLRPHPCLPLQQPIRTILHPFRPRKNRKVQVQNDQNLDRNRDQYQVQGPVFISLIKTDKFIKILNLVKRCKIRSDFKFNFKFIYFLL